MVVVLLRSSCLVCILPDCMGVEELSTSGIGDMWI